ncbi:hypothetical protein D3260_08775 [Salinisphaera sp. Q1T1-3]|nr:hypothetical protein D3260_08775 [Salinisphaera sp. Q1T1-3]
MATSTDARTDTGRRNGGRVYPDCIEDVFQANASRICRGRSASVPVRAFHGPMIFTGVLPW